MDQILNYAVGLVLLGSIALIVWGAVLCLHVMFSTERGSVAPIRSTPRPARHARTAVSLIND